MSSSQKICPQCGTEYPANERFCPRDGTALRSQGGDEDLVGSVIAERYHVMKKLGEGGMGQVYLAEHVKMGRKSAVKVMNPGMVKDVDAIARFNREAANASRINHVNVCGIYDFGETPEGIIYLAMEFIEGQSLTALIESQGALAPMRAAEITRQVAEALGVAHDMGIVHRDLKPDNIMIAKTRDGGDLVKVVDFGIAKATGAENQKVTKTGLVVGTPEFMSPEQLAGDKLDGRSDLYSLGLVAFNMFTGRLPFPGETSQETMIMRLTDHPKTLADMKPDIAWPHDVQAAFDKALARNSSDRYQTAPEFGRALYAAVERMPHSQASVVGTHVMGSVTPKGGATVPVPATRVATPTDVGAKAAAVPAGAGKSKTPMLAGIGVAAVLVISVGGWFLTHGSKPSAVADTSAAKVAGGVTATPQGAVKPQDSTTQQFTKQVAPPNSRSNVTRGGESQSVDAVLSSLESDADGTGAKTQADSAKKADAVIARLRQLNTTSITDDEKSHLQYVYFKAYSTKKNDDAACASLKEASRLATDQGRKTTYNNLIAAGCGG